MNEAACLSCPSDDTTQGWQASIHLGFIAGEDKTLLSERRHLGPLNVQRPFYPEGAPCHVYLLHPPGGVVGGDRLHIDVKAQKGAHALLTTPGASKFYRSAGSLALLQQDLHVDNGILEWLPQENIFFPGARVKLDSSIRLNATAQFIGWEIHCLGRPVISEIFNPGSASFRLSVFREERPLLIDRWQIDGRSDLQGAASLRNHPVVGSCLISNADQTMLETVRKTLAQPDHGYLGSTLLGELMVTRYLGDSSEEAQRLFHTLWSITRPLLLKRDACPPRIWAT